MARNLNEWGNALHSGEKIYPIVRQRKRWFAISGGLMALSIAALLIFKINLGIEFVGGTQFIVTSPSQDVSIAQEIGDQYAPADDALATTLGTDRIKLSMGTVDIDTARQITTALADGYGVAETDVASTQIGPTWGAEVGKKAVQGLIVFLLLVSVVMTLYFRAWRMAAAGIVALVHDLLFTVGIYALVGFEVTPASVIGFLTILGYSLYDTVVVFDKVRENTAEVTSQSRFTYAELANLALNQTLVRSINTSIVALLPVASILFIGSFILGAGTLKDISLALFIGMAVGTYSSIFVATPIEVELRSREERIAKHTAKVLALREAGESPVTVGVDGEVRVGALNPGEHLGTGAQPKRKGRK
ncbi:protein translocase subunit SecF [Demequina capsici]|uniref:Protein-export membrane protein SecF n=1 Tax=Demequina capsici TaxID=3075620 RepID=A0AA96JH56_9MICO|nr:MULTISPECIES: protein translocase subunit SecF [unclassified Demequina]WNM25753.1 protein translocase subunit SecF [Demequina sp. OYTSA14]WNM28649.1 protein translocase subunit SecF [Demequina sp. PMTSA13]